jgi:hypothetical protein
LKKFTLALASPAAEKIGWEFKSDEDYLTVQLRKLLIGMAGFAGHERWVPNIGSLWGKEVRLTVF